MNKIIKQAFTLIELLVVIAIIGILSGLIVVSMNGVTDKATIAKSQIFSNSLRNNLMLNIIAQFTFDDIDSANYDSNKIINNVAGNIPDSWSDNEGRAYGGPTLKNGSDCVFGSCLYFDGIDDYVSIASSTNLTTGTFTLEWWMNPDATQSFTSSGIIAKDSNAANEWKIYLVSSTRMDFVNAYTGSLIIIGNPQGLHHWAMTANGYNFSVYKDGQKIIDNITMVAETVGNTQNLYIGRGLNSGDSTWRYFKGFIDNVRIYNAVIPISQIKEQYFNGLNNLFLNGGINREEYLSRINEVGLGN
ncbi:prepilin-type N-terminal cleavage/methylation domain-containing protein [bacterium]|jgi:prepilin-type N-terminal cleavage/methylation domain-containing protein|nr:prepilin-type N-terminal cleavage/methylation domain-containing protein [bacterium]